MKSDFTQKIDKFVTQVGLAGGSLLFLLTAVVCFDVISRKFFVFQSTMMQELEWHIHTIIFFLAIPMAYLRGVHVRIDTIRGNFSQSGKAKLEIIGLSLLAIPFTLLLFKYGIDLVVQSYVQKEGSTSMQGIHHRWIIKTIIPISMALLFLAQIATLIRCVQVLRGKAELPEAVDKENF